MRERLERRLARLEDRTRRIESDLRRPGDRDWAERATERQNDEVLEQLGDAEVAEIELIRAALTRLDEGRFGVCRRCDAEIDAPRLDALPFADTCIGCAD